MRFGPGRLVVLSGLVPTIIAALLSLFRPSFLSNWEYGAYDAILRATPTRPPGGRITIVDIDDRSLTTVGQWPWRRDVIGQLIARLRDLGASIVALDIMFAEPDRFEGFGTTPDEKLAETLAGGRVVLGYAMTFDGESDAASPCLLHPLGLAVMRRDDSSDQPYFHATGAVCNLPVLTKAVNASGFMNAAPDPDGLLRRIPVLIEKDGLVYPSLAVTSVMSITGTRDATLRVDTCQLTGVAARQAKRAARRPEQSSAALPRSEANVPVRLGGRRAPRTAGPRHLQGQDRAGRNDRARHTRSRVDAARHAFCRRRGSGHGRRQHPPAGLHPAAVVRGRARDAARHRAGPRLGAARPALWVGHRRRGSGGMPGAGLVRPDPADGDERRLPLPSFSDHGPDIGPGRDDGRAIHERAAAGRSGRRGDRPPRSG